ncbi:putative HTH-type transcriptional regulator YtdP [Paenibacillus albidus]|uniref:HTH-type transcriptional regulator YtdP n=1 Tax=Paenibacillus albidus TaxID=2041023 RepID=A0A917CPE7_9BACL|nr:AraC family transcriptional regulator [Paenibacillus albidus]GGF92055.1 putative HTH-type transcriptional regulator YtdP [Paenibacillus albidus]
MKGLLTSKFASNALFVKLMLSFLSVILILASFNLFSHLYLSGKVYQEMVRQNELGLAQTVEGYENHFRLTQNMILALTQSEPWTANLGILSHLKENRRYDIPAEVKSDLATLYANPFLHIENFILYFKQEDYVLEKEGLSSTSDMFGKYYFSEEYPPGYWSRQTMDNQFLKVMPAASFTENTMFSSRPLGRLMPVMVKAIPYEEVYGIVMLNPQRMQTAYGNAGNNPFYILDAQGKLLFSTAENELPEPEFPASGSAHKRVGDQYYFYEKGKQTGFTYVRVTQVAAIAAEMRGMRLLLAVLLTAAVLISILSSLFFSLRLNQPLQRLIAALDRKSGSTPDKLSSVKEFAIIGDRLSSILENNRFIQTDLEHKNSLVRQYAYTHKVKNIPLSGSLADLEDVRQSEQPYASILFKVSFKSLPDEFERHTLMLWKLIQSLMAAGETDRVALQPEQDQLLLLLFDPGPQSGILQALDTLKELLATEDSLYLTIAVSPVYSGETSFTDAYNNLSMLLGERRLNGETQIIVEPRASPSKSFHLKVTHGDELHNLLQSGSEEAVFAWLDRQLEQLRHKDAAAEDFRAFALGAAEQTGKTVMKLNVPQAEAERLSPPPGEPFATFHSTQQYREWLHDLVRPVLAAIRSTSETRDPVISFVLDYLDKHCGEDINLNLVADKLNLTPGYLSSIFKEKTGINFSEYLNNLRIERAKELLMNLDLLIQDIALQVGYQNVNSFIRMFKRSSGLTPGEYRKRYSGEDSLPSSGLGH